MTEIASLTNREAHLNELNLIDPNPARDDSSRDAMSKHGATEDVRLVHMPENNNSGDVCPGGIGTGMSF